MRVLSEVHTVKCEERAQNRMAKVWQASVAAGVLPEKSLLSNEIAGRRDASRSILRPPLAELKQAAVLGVGT